MNNRRSLFVNNNSLSIQKTYLTTNPIGVAIKTATPKQNAFQHNDGLRLITNFIAISPETMRIVIIGSPTNFMSLMIITMRPITVDPFTISSFCNVCGCYKTCHNN